jgi:hypothetical protein
MRDFIPNKTTMTLPPLTPTPLPLAGEGLCKSKPLASKRMQSIAVRRNLRLCITVHSLLFIIKKGEDHG